MSVMVTGGAGYIGSHAAQRLLRDGRTVVVLDNLFRGHREAVERLATGTGERLHFVEADVRDRAAVERAIVHFRVTEVLHFAALAYVGESVTRPLEYHAANTAGSIALLQACDAAGRAEADGYAGVHRLVFSSTCATYGEPAPEFIPIPEHCPQRPINPYGWSKLHVERVLRDYLEQTRGEGRPFACAALRYFNVAGCDRTGLLGEHHEPETHLIPVVLQAALGKREAVTIFGTDYPTPDGTCIRDYVHVEDLVGAHVAVLDALGDGEWRAYNLGIGKGYSVREIIESARRVTGKQIEVREGPRRPGDPPTLFADPRRIAGELAWSAPTTDLDEIVASAWRWFREHPNGYER